MAYTLVLGVIVWIGSIIWCVMKFSDTDNKVWVLIGVIITVAGLGYLLDLGIKQAAKGPCLEYETGTRYDPALKMVRTYRYCSQRAEWVE